MELYSIETSVCYLHAGMYLARLQSIPQKGQMISLSVAPVSSDATVEFFPSSDADDSMLDNIDKCLVIRVTGKGRGAVLVASSIVKGVEPLVLKVDAISNALTTQKKASLAASRDNSIRRQAARKEVPGEQVTLLGHVAWQGDVKKNAGQWLGDPASVKAIEGIGIHWENKPDDVDIAFSCRVKDMGRTPMALNGGFVGTRQRAKPILGFMISLVGNHATNFEVRAEAVFQGSEVQKVISGVECQGVTGDEPLVALKLRVLPVKNKKQQQTELQSNNNWTLHTV